MNGVFSESIKLLRMKKSIDIFEKLRLISKPMQQEGSRNDQLREPSCHDSTEKC